MLGLVNVIVDFEVFKGCDLIVEVVFEDVGVKVEMIKKVEVIVGEDCVFVINIFILLIIELVKVLEWVDKFIGIYFFLFVEKMMLVEIIKGKEIGDVVVVKVFDFVC